MSDLMLLCISVATMATAGATWRSRWAPGPERRLAGCWVVFVVLISAGSALPDGQRFAITGIGIFVLMCGAYCRPLLRRCAGTERPSATNTAQVVAACLLLAVSLWLCLVDLLQVAEAPQRLPANLAAVAVGVGVLRVVRTGGLPRAAMAMGGLCALSLLMLWSLLLPSGGFGPCRDTKCNPFGSLLYGPFASENVLAMIGCVTAVFVLTGLRARTRVAGAVACFAVILLTGSRTGLLVLVVLIVLTVAWHLVFRLIPDAARLDGAVNRALLYGVATGAGLTLLGLHLVSGDDPRALTGRGIIWIRASAALEGQELFGMGMTSWSLLQGVGELPSHFAHSQYMAVLFAGGYVGLVLQGGALSAAAVAALRTARSPERSAMVALMPVLALGAYGLTEVVWNPLTVDHLSWMVAAAVLAAALPPRDSAPPVGRGPGAERPLAGPVRRRPVTT